MRKRLALGVAILGSVLAANAELHNGDRFNASYCGEDYKFWVMSEKDALVEVYSLESYYTEYYIGTTIKLPDYVTDSETGKEYKVVRIGADLLAGYDKITGVEIPSTVTEIEESAFKGCKSLKSVDFGDSIVKIGQGAFYGCESLEMINLPETVEEIGASAIYNCASLTAIIIPDSVTEIAGSAFGDCHSVKPLVIGKSVKNIESGAFTWMQDGSSQSAAGIYEDLYMLPENPPKLEDSYMGSSGKAYCPAESVAKYNGSGAWMAVGTFEALPNVFAVFYKERFMVEEGEEVELLYKSFNPGNVEIISEEWAPFNDKAVSVENGVATGIKSGEATTVTYRVKDSEGGVYESECIVEVIGVSGIDSVADDSCEMDGVYTVSGVRAGDNTESLAPGLYIVKKGAKATKIMVGK